MQCNRFGNVMYCVLCCGVPAKKIAAPRAVQPQNARVAPCGRLALGFWLPLSFLVADEKGLLASLRSAAPTEG